MTRGWEFLLQQRLQFAQQPVRKNLYSRQLMFVRDMIILIKHRGGWELIRQRKQTQINRDNARKNKHRVEYYYKVGDKVMLANHTACKY